MSNAKKKAKPGTFAPRTPPKPGFSIRAFLARKKEQCMICLEKSSQVDFKSLGCNHRFHFHCLATMLNNGHRTCPLCRANMNDSWLEAEEMAEFFISDVVDEVFDDMWLPPDEDVVQLYDEDYYDADDDDYLTMYGYGSEYYGSDLSESDDDDVNHYQGEFPHRRIDVFELDDLGLVQLFSEDNNADDGVSHGSDLFNGGSHDSNYFNSEFPHRRIDVFELDDLGLVQLFQEDNDAVNGSTDTDDDGDFNYEEFESDDSDWW